MEYKDRGMLKYQGFILSEHHDALENPAEKQWNIRQKLTTAFKNQKPITIKYKENIVSARIKEIDYIMDKITIINTLGEEKIIIIDNIETLYYEDEVQ